MFKYFSIIAFLSIACGSLGPHDGDAAPPIVEPSFDPVLAAELSTAFDDAIAATGTPWAPWTVVPADSKTHRNLMIAQAVVQTLQGLKLRYPPGSPELAHIRVE